MKVNKRIFISHAGKDKELVDSFVDLLQTGMDIKSGEIFCSSLGGLRIPGGSNFIEYIRDQLRNSEVVIALLSLNYFQSQFCLCELGAAWALSHRFEPMLVPPCSYSNLQGIMAGTQVTDVQNSKLLTEFQERLSSVLRLKTNQARWEEKRDAFLKTLPRLISNIYGVGSPGSWDILADSQSRKVAGSKREIAFWKYGFERDFYYRCTKCSDTIVRCRGGSSIFSIPSKMEDMRVGRDMKAADFHEIEQERKRLYIKLVERGYQFRYIIELNPEEWRRKGYSTDQCREKLLSLKAFFDRYQYHPNITVALKNHGDSQMYVIFGDYFVIESTKENPRDRRAYDACRIYNDGDYIRGSIARFDDEFQSLLAHNADRWNLGDSDDYRSRNLKILETIERQLSSLTKGRR